MGYALITGWAFEEGQVVEAAKAGDQESIVRLLDRFFPQIYRWMLSRAHDEEQAKELAEKVYYRMLDELPSFNYKDTPMVTWLYELSKRVFEEESLAVAAKR
ncbi:MAG TPA: hypothetical protein VFB90_08275 [Dehalococcoidia bacterium]|nr:hypothetical protein [Dehalococcoidia bacterium]